MQRKTTLALSVVAAVSWGVVSLRELSRPPAASRAPEPRELDVSHVKPGGRFAFSVAGRTVGMSIPAGEGHSFGSFHITSGDYSSGGRERDGSLHRIFIGDVTADGSEDAVIMIQSGGSGSYANLFVLESAITNFNLVRLPEFSVPGYMGHDRVAVRDGSVVREFPTYVNKERLRVDRQWETKDALQGKLPVRKKADSNVNPSGATKTFKYDRARATWVPF